MKGKTLDKNHIEMRSEKVRKIVSTNPPMFISWGIIIIMLVFMILFVIVLNLSYPYEGGETVFQHFWGCHLHCVTDSLSVMPGS